MTHNIGVTAEQQLLNAFESSSVSPDQWTHRAHVRVAYLFASRFDLDTAIARMRSGLQALNAVHRVPDSVDRGYNETIRSLRSWACYGLFLCSLRLSR